MFFPLKDENPVYSKPIVTVTLIIINVIIFVFSYFRGAQEFQLFIIKYGLIPYEIMTQTEVYPQYQQLSFPAMLTPFTSMFMHGSILHLGGNMLFLWIFGNNIEDYYGHVKFIIFYLISGLAAVFLFMIFGPYSKVPLVGASGAISGVLGAYLVLYPRARIVTLVFLFYFIRIVRLPASFMLGFWILYQVFMALASGATGSGVAWLAHIGGFAFGWAWVKFVSIKRKRPHHRARIYLD